jgi:hypothetical protein
MSNAPPDHDLEDLRLVPFLFFFAMITPSIVYLRYPTQFSWFISACCVCGYASLSWRLGFSVSWLT